MSDRMTEAVPEARERDEARAPARPSNVEPHLGMADGPGSVEPGRR
ncbi:hypothetical protein [Pseudonocardia sp. NPDC049154]